MLFLNRHHRHQVSCVLSFRRAIEAAAVKHSRKSLSPSSRDILLESCEQKNGKIDEDDEVYLAREKKGKNLSPHSPTQRQTHLRKSYWKISILIMYTTVFRLPSSCSSPFAFAFAFALHRRNTKFISSWIWELLRVKRKIEEKLLTTRGRNFSVGGVRHGKNYGISFRASDKCFINSSLHGNSLLS